MREIPIWYLGTAQCIDFFFLSQIEPHRLPISVAIHQTHLPHADRRHQKFDAIDIA
jgi:hypothetical protein